MVSLLFFFLFFFQFFFLVRPGGLVSLGSLVLVLVHPQYKVHPLLSPKKKRDAELVYYVKPANFSSPPNDPNSPILIPHEVSLRTRLDRFDSSPARSFQSSYFRFQPILLLVSCLLVIGDYYPDYSFLSIPIPIPIRPVLPSTNNILYLSYFFLLLYRRDSCLPYCLLAAARY